MRTPVLFAALVVASVFLLGLGLSAFMFKPDEAELGAKSASEVDQSPRGEVSPTTVAGSPVASGVRVVDVDGELLRTDGSGSQVAVRVGESIPLGERLELAAGEARVSVAEGTVELFGGAAAVFPGRGEVSLEVGRLRALVEDARSPLRIRFANSDAVAETVDGDIVALSDGSGAVTIGAERGQVRFSAQGQSVDVAEGQESSVMPEGAPSVPHVPATLFLRVRRPPSETRTRHTTVRGRTVAGTVVRVNGTPVVVAQDGNFETRVPLAEGRNRVAIQSENAWGGVTQRNHTVVVDSHAARIGSDVSW